jgi:hypothetical protein
MLHREPETGALTARAKPKTRPRTHAADLPKLAAFGRVLACGQVTSLTGSSTPTWMVVGRYLTPTWWIALGFGREKIY